MIYSFRIVSDEVDDFIRDIDIDADSTFLDLHNAICDAIGHDTAGAMRSFYVCDEGTWDKGRELALVDMGADLDQDVTLMEEARLGDVLDDEGQRLVFTFDFLADRSLYMELRRTRPGEHLDAPMCTRSQGEAPAEHVADLDDFDAANDALAARGVKGAAARGADADEMDLDADFYGEEGYNDDEMDFESYDDYNN